MADDKKHEEVKGLFKALGEKIDKLIFKPKALTVQDGAGTDIDFPDLAEDATPQVGDKATVDGSPASGEYVMPDGKTFVFEAGALAEIKEPEPEESEEMAALKEQVENLKTENETLKASNTKLEEENGQIQAKAKEVETEFVALKSKLTSEFNIDFKAQAKPAGESEGNQKPTVRTAALKDLK